MCGIIHHPCKVSSTCSSTFQKFKTFGKFERVWKFFLVPSGLPTWRVLTPTGTSKTKKHSSRKLISTPKCRTSGRKTWRHEKKFKTFGKFERVWKCFDQLKSLKLLESLKANGLCKLCCCHQRREFEIHPTKLGFKLHPQKKRNFERSFYMGH